MTRQITILGAFLLIIMLTGGCTASVLIPPLSGPLFVPSTAFSAYQIYQIGNDERSMQTIIEDEFLETSIHAAILKDNELEAMKLSPYSYNGNIYVIGESSDNKDFARIRRVVRRSGKVNSLTTYLYPDTENPKCNDAEDFILETKVKAALLSDQKTRGINVAVKSVQCNIVLLGRVGSYKEAYNIKNVASSVIGTVSVKSFIKPSNINNYKTSRRRIATAE